METGVEEALHELPMEPHARLTLESHLRELSFYQKELSEVEEQLRQMARQQGNAVAYLQSVPKVGEVVATTFMFELFDPERFQRAEEVTRYLGLAPMVRHSGEKTPSDGCVPWADPTAKFTH